jgi:CheY-like chemotaxis protein
MVSTKWDLDYSNRIAKTVFAIDDNPYFINTLVSLFERLGCDYKTFNHPDKMLEVLSNLKENVSVILLDYQMPEIDGINLAKKIRKNSDFDSIPMILLSQYKELLNIQKKEEIERLFLEVIFKGDIFTALPTLFNKIFKI